MTKALSISIAHEINFFTFHFKLQLELCDLRFPECTAEKLILLAVVLCLLGM